ncbi:unnamed protein product [Ectocarpus sp. 8 AP-2014]
MEHRRGELAYKAVLDKRVCPGCGAEQSYDEVGFDTKCHFDMGKHATPKIQPYAISRVWCLQ